MFEEIPKALIIETYVSESFIKNNNEEILNNLKYTILSDTVFKHVSDTVTPQGILAVVKQNSVDVNEVFKSEKDFEKITYLILDDIRDPGNMGTIIRTAEGAGVSGIFISKDSVDVYNPKVIRSTMGSLFRVPFVFVDDLEATVLELKKNNVIVYAAHLDGEEINREESSGDDVCFIIGNESKGISAGVLKLADKLVKIPMLGKIESLNASISAAILMYSRIM